MSPVAWKARGIWRRLLAKLKKLRAARKTKTTGRRRAPNRRQLRCGACQLFVRRLCQKTPDPCGVCPSCCPGNHRPPKPEGAQS